MSVSKTIRAAAKTLRDRSPVGAALIRLVRGAKSLGVPVDEIRVSGGGAKSEFWRQLQADIYGQPVSTINAAEGPAYGVALLAAVGTGAFESVEEACAATIHTVRTTRQDASACQQYAEHYATFATLYPALAPHFAKFGQTGQSMS